MKIPSFTYTLLGKLVIEVDCRGCMAEGHVIKRVGEITRVASQRILLNLPKAEAITMAECRTINSRTDGGSDAADEFFYAPIGDGGFQRSSSPNVFFWRH